MKLLLPQSSQILFFFTVKCTYTVTSDVITITCSGGIGAVDRYEYTVNGGQVMTGEWKHIWYSMLTTLSKFPTGTRFPITISTDNPDLSPSGNNQVVITLKRANGTTLDVQTISIQTSKYAIIPATTYIIISTFNTTTSKGTY